MESLILVEGERYEQGTEVEIDGKRFVRCVFDHCRLVYSGDQDLSFERCTFIGVDWRFAGAAENVLTFMGDMYQGLGDEGRLIESLFAAVRKNDVYDADIPILSDRELSRARMAS